MILKRIGYYLDFVKIGHTLFALPFCLIPALVIWRRSGVAPAAWLWIVAAFAGARGFAMAANRILDRAYDAQNPRTSGRHLPAGLISLSGAASFASLCAALFVVASWRLSSLCLILAPFVLLILAGYSWCKRFTALSHLVLGFCLALAPLGVEIALLGRVTLPTTALALGVLVWVAGFDIFYACMDIDFDRRAGLHSIPAKWGAARALMIARLFHAMTFGLFVLYGLWTPELGAIYFAAQALVLALLVYEHKLVGRGDPKQIEMAFFNLNGAISLLQLAAVAVDIAL